MRKELDYSRFKAIGEEASAEAEGRGITDSKELSKIKKEAIKQKVYEIGRNAEYKFQLEAFNDPRVSYVKSSSHADDMFSGADCWVRFNDDCGLPPFFYPVQVKSSDKDVDAFRNHDEKYLAANMAMFVINAGPSAKPEDISKQMDDEFKRIKKLFDENPDHAVILPQEDMGEGFSKLNFTRKDR